MPAGKRKDRRRRRCATSSAATSRRSAPRTRSSSTPSPRRSPRARRASSRWSSELADAPRARSVADPLTLPKDAGLIARDGRTAIIPVDLAVGADATRPVAAGALGDYVAGLKLAPGATAKVTGEWPVWSDFNTVNAEALHKAELVSGLPTLILLFLAFGSLIAAGIPLLLALAGIAVGFAALHLLSLVTPLSVWSMNFSMMIGLAVGIDYSLFIVSRYREERIEGKDAIAAIENTMSTAGKAVFLSALTVVLALSAVFLVPIMVFRSMALGMILSVVAVALASLTLLPAVLVALGDRVLVTRGKQDPDIVAESRWARWTSVSLRRPGTVLAIGLLLLGLLIVPAVGMHLGMPGAGVVDHGRTSRDGYELLVKSFGPGAAAPAFITVPATAAPTVVRIASADSAVVDARIVSRPCGERSYRRARHRHRPPSTTPGPRHSCTACATGSPPRSRPPAWAAPPPRTPISPRCSPGGPRSRSASSC